MAKEKTAPKLREVPNYCSAVDATGAKESVNQTAKTKNATTTQQTSPTCPFVPLPRVLFNCRTSGCKNNVEIQCTMRTNNHHSSSFIGKAGGTSTQVSVRARRFISYLAERASHLPPCGVCAAPSRRAGPTDSAPRYLPGAQEKRQHREQQNHTASASNFWKNKKYPS